MTQRQARKDSKADQKRLKGRLEKTQRHARKTERMARKDSKAR